MPAMTLSQMRQEQPAVVMAALGLVSGLLSALAFDSEPTWLAPVGRVFFLEPGPTLIGIYYGVAVALGIWSRAGNNWALPVLLVTTMYAWSAAIQTAIRTQRNTGDDLNLILASLAAGAVGAGLTHLGCALFETELRRPWRIALSCAVGAIAGLLFYLGERKFIDERLLFVVWQPAVSFCIGLGLARRA